MLYATRYIRPGAETLVRLVRDDLPYLDFADAEAFYDQFAKWTNDPRDKAFLAANDRYYLLTRLLHRVDARHPWLYDRCREVEAEPDECLDLWGREHYKGCPLVELVPTPTNWKSYGDLAVGDQIFGADGKPCRVIAKTDPFIDPNSFEVVFDDGTICKVSSQHRWEVERRSKKRVAGAWSKDGSDRRIYRETVVLDTETLAAMQHRPDRRLSVRVAGALDLPHVDLPLDPYVLGAWLGDGSRSGAQVAGIDEGIFEEIARRGWRIGKPGKSSRTVLGLAASLRVAGVFKNKHVPAIYLRSSARQRLDLLRGLMDTDGHCNTRGTATFFNKNEALADAVFELAASLGMKPRKYVYDASHGRFWQVAFQAYQDDAPFCLERKVRRCKIGARPNPRRYIVAVRKAEPEPMCCIQVDRPDGLYLTGRAMVPTHNSTIITFCGTIQEVIRDPEITIAIFCHTAGTARKFLQQIKYELEHNVELQEACPDVFWASPVAQAPKWSVIDGLVVKRLSNPKEATIEAHGLVDGMPTGTHFRLREYDDLIEEKYVTNPEMVEKATTAWEQSDNLGTTDGRRWHAGTRWSYADTYQEIIDKKLLKLRIYPSTDNGRLDGKPVFLPADRWRHILINQSRVVAAQHLQNPAAASQHSFDIGWLKFFEVRPVLLNVYIMVDPSAGRKKTSDRTAIAVVGVDAAKNKYLLDGYRHRMKLSEKWRLIKHMHEKWTRAQGVQYVHVGFETFGQQSTELMQFQEWMIDEKYEFPIMELNKGASGEVSKKERIGRLQPDIQGLEFTFFFPCVVYYRGLGVCRWRPDPEKNQIEYDPVALEFQHEKDGEVVASTRDEFPLSRPQLEAVKKQQKFTIAKPIRQIDEAGEIYDLTRAFFEELRYFPARQGHDDLIDAASRVYDMLPSFGPPVAGERIKLVEPIWTAA